MTQFTHPIQVLFITLGGILCFFVLAVCQPGPVLPEACEPEEEQKHEQD